MEVIQPNNEPTTSGNPTIIVNQPVPKSNGMGTAGFVLALLALFLGRHLVAICVCRLVRRRCGIGNLIAFLYTVKLSP